MFALHIKAERRGDGGVVRGQPVSLPPHLVGQDAAAAAAHPAVVIQPVSLESHDFELLPVIFSKREEKECRKTKKSSPVSEQ